MTPFVRGSEGCAFLLLTITLGETQGLDVAGHCGLVEVIAMVADRHGNITSNINGLLS
jgi:hypothetical protein